MESKMRGDSRAPELETVIKCLQGKGACGCSRIESSTKKDVIAAARRGRIFISSEWWWKWIRRNCYRKIWDDIMRMVSLSHCKRYIAKAYFEAWSSETCWSYEAAIKRNNGGDWRCGCKVGLCEKGVDMWVQCAKLRKVSLGSNRMAVQKEGLGESCGQ